MEKIKITVEQEEALKDFKKYTDDFEKFVTRNSKYTNIYKPLNDFTPEQFALLLCGWYEVEQPFEVGDWVIAEKSYGESRYLKIESVVGGELKFHTKTWGYKRNYKKVTEPWKIMLLELGRDKPEFREGDRYITVEDYSRAVTHDDSKDYALETAKENRIKYFYPVESRIEVKGNGGFNGTE